MQGAQDCVLLSATAAGLFKPQAEAQRGAALILGSAANTVRESSAAANSLRPPAERQRPDPTTGKKASQHDLTIDF